MLALKGFACTHDQSRWFKLQHVKKNDTCLETLRRHRECSTMAEYSWPSEMYTYTDTNRKTDAQWDWHNPIIKSCLQELDIPIYCLCEYRVVVQDNDWGERERRLIYGHFHYKKFITGISERTSFLPWYREPSSCGFSTVGAQIGLHFSVHKLYIVDRSTCYLFSCTEHLGMPCFYSFAVQK